MEPERRPSAAIAWLRARWERLAAVALIVSVVVGLVVLLNRSRPPDLAYLGTALPPLLEGAVLTLVITVAAYAVGMGMGFMFGWLRTLRVRPARVVATVWIESIRGTPLFVQLLLLLSVLSFYNPGNLPTSVRLLLTGFLALLINTSAYQAEIFRAGLQSVATGQVEAAKSVGLTYWGSMRTVILPQAFRVIIPPMTNEFILLLKGSALLYFIGVHELTFEGRFLSFTSGRFIEVYIVMVSLYLLMTLPLMKGVAWLERRYRIPGVGLQAEAARKGGRPVGGAVARVFGSSRSVAARGARGFGGRAHGEGPLGRPEPS